MIVVADAVVVVVEVCITRLLCRDIFLSPEKLILH